MSQWNSVDLIVACNFASIDWAKTNNDPERPGPTYWADRVARAYDHELAQTCERVVKLYPKLSPADAARKYLTLQTRWSQRMVYPDLE